jgi:hypothetical protein
MAWVKFHDELRRGAKRGLPRAVRFVFLELCLETRPGRGVIALPAGMTDVEAVHDMLGGSRREIVESLKQLTAGAEPMVLILDGPDGRTLAIPSWAAWNSTDISSARVQKLRERRRGEQNGPRVYFIRRPSDGQIKIGFSDNVGDRLVNLRAEYQEPLDLLTVIPGGQPEEAALHARFADIRERGEWFRATPELLAYVESCNATRVTAPPARETLSDKIREEEIREERDLAAGEPPPAKPPRKPRAPKPDTPEPSGHREVIDHYFAVFEGRRGVKPAFGGREGKAVKTLLEALGGDVERAKAAIRTALEPGSWPLNATILDVAKDPSRYLGAVPARLPNNVQPVGPRREWSVPAGLEDS